MSTNNSSNYDDASSGNTEISPPVVVRFWLMLLINVASTICTFWIIIYIISDRVRRYTVQNHTILLILIIGLPIQLMDINFYLIFDHYGSVQPSNPIVCLIWWVADFGCFNGGIILIAWLAIERHILIFHDRWVRNQRGRFLFHYLPLIILVTYILLFYIIAVFFLPCENVYDYTLAVCGDSPCYETYGILGLWDFTGNTCLPILLESIVSTALILRVQWQKRRLHQSGRWRKQRRMIIQLCLVSGLNTSINLPLYLIYFAHLCGLPSQYGAEIALYLGFLCYFVVLLFPFASLCQYPGLRKIIKNKLFCISPRQPSNSIIVASTRSAMPMSVRAQ